VCIPLSMTISARRINSKKRTDYWNKITQHTHTHTQTYTRQRLWIRAEWSLLYTKFSKLKAISPPVLVSVSTAVLTLAVSVNTEPYTQRWFQASAAMFIIYRRFGTTCRFHLHGSRFRVGKKASKETWQHSGIIITRRRVITQKTTDFYPAVPKVCSTDPWIHFCNGYFEV
jgi:hypothetical protein